MANPPQPIPQSTDEIHQWLEHLTDPNQADVLSDRVQHYAPNDLFAVLVPLLSDESIWHRIVAVLMEVDSDRAFPFLEHYLQHPDRYTRGTIVPFLTWHAVPAAFGPLITIVTTDPDASVRADAAT